MRLFLNKRKINQLEKLISTLNETEEIMQKTLNVEIDTLKKLISISNNFRDLNHKTDFDFVGEQLKIIEDKQTELEEKRKEILYNYDLLIKEYS